MSYLLTILRDHLRALLYSAWIEQGLHGKQQCAVGSRKGRVEFILDQDHIQVRALRIVNRHDIRLQEFLRNPGHPDFLRQAEGIVRDFCGDP